MRNAGCSETMDSNVKDVLESGDSERRATRMTSSKIGTWTGRIVALLAAVIIPACGSSGSPGGSNPNGILWNSQGVAGGGGTPGPATLFYIPASDNTGLGAATIGISNIIVSTDDATYDAYYPNGGNGLSATKITYQFGNLHPLSTDTGSIPVTSRENTLSGLINGYRQQQLGNVGAGGGGGVGGGVAVGNTTGIILAGHFKGTKSARAHCKYYALGYDAAANFGIGPNAEGDSMQVSANPFSPFGTPAPGNPDGDQGRLGKIGVVAYVPTFARADFCVSGTQYSEADAVMSYLLRTAPGALAATGPTNMAVGHWRGGTQAFWWDVIYLLNPTPAN